MEHRGSENVNEPAISAQQWTELTQNLAKLPAHEYDSVRKAEAERLGVRYKTLDEAVERWRGGGGPTHGRRLSIDAPDPWQTEVSLADLLDDLVVALKRHVIMAPSCYICIALWVAHTFVYERFQHTPRLGITSADKRCGKSTLLEILRLVCLCPVKADSLSAASVYRTIASVERLTLLIDEADSFLPENEELRGVLNSGFEMSGIVIRVAEIQGEHVPIQFNTFAPVALAAIGTLPGTIEDRALPIRMDRKLASQTIAKLREAGARSTLGDIARKLLRWSEDYGAKLNSNPPVPAAMNDREGDISVPLLAIADSAGPAWGKLGRDALLAIFRVRAADEDAAGTGAMLLSDCRAIFKESGSQRLPSARLAQLLGEMESRPWAEWRQGKPMTAPQLARVLAPFKVRPEVMRVPGESGLSRGYQADFFADAWARYLVAPQIGGSET